MKRTAERCRTTRLGKALSPGRSAPAEPGRRSLADYGMSVCEIDHPTIRNPAQRGTTRNAWQASLPRLERGPQLAPPGAGSAIRNSSRGQAMAEYVIIAGLLMASLGILTVFFVTFKEYGGRILALVSSEYP